MAYPKRPRFAQNARRRFKQMKTFGKKAMSYAGTAVKAYRTAMALKAMVNTEKKLQLINGLAQPVYITGTIYPLMAHSQGTGLGNRIGNTIRLKSYQLRCEVAPATGAPSRLRVMVVQDKRTGYQASTNTLTTLSLADILQDSTNPIVSPWSNENYGRWRILKDKTLNLDPNNYPRSMWSFYKKFHSLVRYPDNTVNTPIQGQLYLVVVSEIPSGSPNAPLFSYYGQSRFIDN